jgi:hypothetical protein
MNPTTAQALKRTRANAAARKTAPRDRHTLLLDPLLSMKLGVEAARRGLDRSDTVNHILAEALRHIVISVREHSPSSANPAVESSPVSPETATAA